MAKSNPEELQRKLNEGLGVEHEIDSFLVDWEKNRKPRPLSLLERTRKAINNSLTPLGQVVAATIMLIAVVFSVVTIPFWAIPTETRSGWHPHQFHTGCLQLGNSQIRICSTYGYKFTNAPLVRYDLSSHAEPCYLGLSKCKRDAEEVLNQVAELQRELNNREEK